MKQYRILALAALAALGLSLGAAPAAQAECKLGLVAAFPIIFVNNKPMVEASINGKPAHLRLTLSGQTVFWGSALKDYNLKREDFEGKAYAEGGATDVIGVRVGEIKIGSFVQKNASSFLAPGVNTPDEAGAFGTGLLDGKTDLELDFAHNAVRLFKAEGCKDDEVVYWGGSYSVVEDTPSGIPVKLAGQTLMAELGVGDEVSFVTVDGARRVGASLRAAGRLPMGMLAGVVKPVDVSIATFPELVVGDETIKNVSLAVGDVFPDNQEVDTGSRISNKVVSRPEFMLGGDFIKSHRIYISNQQKKTYFSYVGGAAFTDIYARLGATPATPPQTPKP